VVLNFDGRLINYDFGELDESIPAYCGYHSQVSGFGISGGGDSAFDPALSDAAAQSPYTGIMRGKRLVVLVGQRRALAIAVRNSRAERRWSKLNQWLRGEVALEA
jgi:exodeoxyribonuclease V alpha subunit